MDAEPERRMNMTRPRPTLIPPPGRPGPGYEWDDLVQAWVPADEAPTWTDTAEKVTRPAKAAAVSPAPAPLPAPAPVPALVPLTDRERVVETLWLTAPVGYAGTTFEVGGGPCDDGPDSNRPAVWLAGTREECAGWMIDYTIARPLRLVGHEAHRLGSLAEVRATARSRLEAAGIDTSALAEGETRAAIEARVRDDIREAAQAASRAEDAIRAEARAAARKARDAAPRREGSAAWDAAWEPFEKRIAAAQAAMAKVSARDMDAEIASAMKAACDAALAAAGLPTTTDADDTTDATDTTDDDEPRRGIVTAGTYANFHCTIHAVRDGIASVTVSIFGRDTEAEIPEEDVQCF